MAPARHTITDAVSAPTPASQMPWTSWTSTNWTRTVLSTTTHEVINHGATHTLAVSHAESGPPKGNCAGLDRSLRCTSAVAKRRLGPISSAVTSTLVR